MGVGSGGDYAQEKRWHTDKTTDVQLLAADGGKADCIAPKSASHQLFIQKITATVQTAAAQAVTIRDDSTTNIVLGVIEASAAVGTIRIFDFGPKGIALGVGKNLDIANTAGPAIEFHIEAYEKLGAAISYLAGASSQ